MSPAVEAVLSRLSPKARAQAEAELARQGHPDFVMARHVFPEPITVKHGETLAITYHADGSVTGSAVPVQRAPEPDMAHDPYDVTGGQPVPVKRKGKAKAAKLAEPTSTPELPPIPTIVCHNKLPSLSLTLKHPVPSWNAILGLQHFSRAKLKKAIQDDFLSALRASADDSSTRTTSARSTLSIAAATLDSYQRTMQERRKLRSRKSKSGAKKKSARRF